MNIRKAQRAQSKIKVGISGPSGSGKTYSSLLIAKGLQETWDKVVLIDSEHGSSHLYSHLGPFNVLQLQPPFEPEKYIIAIQECVTAQMGTIIIDNISHSWQFLIDYHAKLTGNSFANWAKITPRQTALVEAILGVDAHVICTLRSKQSYVLDFHNGKHKVRKVGLKPIQRDDFSYELTLMMDLDHDHKCTISKDRTNIFKKFRAADGFNITEETGKLLKVWSEQGYSIEDQITETSSVGSLNELYHELLPVSESYKELFRIRKEALENHIISSNGVSTNS